MSETPPLISSFILRFIQSESSSPLPTTRGSIRHIQSGQEASFLNWQDVQAFVQRFVDLNEELSTKDSD
ncbi:MAG: hypothetical protein ACK2UW_03235 [Anaerolineales bacterium]|jgi:hypothetical protein